MNIILTATISPCKNQPYLAVHNPLDRFEQYRKAVTFYLKCQNISGVVLCDNSQSEDSDFSQEVALAKKLNKPLEILYIHTDESMISQYGKGYGEAEILDYVVDHSKILNEDPVFFKVTGRLLLLNVDTLIKKAEKTPNVLFINQCGNKSVDSRFFIAESHTYKRFFRDVKYQVNDNNTRYLENVYYDIITSNKLETKCFSQFPRVKGQSGSLGYYYNDKTWKRRIKLVWRDILSNLNYYIVK